MCPRRGAARPGRRTTPRRSAPRVARDRRRAPAERSSPGAGGPSRTGRCPPPTPARTPRGSATPAPASTPRQRPCRARSACSRGATNDRRVPNDHGPPPGTWSSGAYCRNAHHAPFTAGCADPLLEPRRTLRDRTRLGEVVDELGNHPVGVVEGQPAGGEPAVVQPGCAQRGFHRLAERPIVADVDGVQGDPHQRGLDHVAGGEGAVEVSGVEVADPVPQGDVRRRWLLGLEGDDAAYRIGRARRLAVQQQLAGEGRPVEAAGGDLGVGHVA